ncbi:MAG TPA: preprotein translocase subunit SecE [Clostridiaceae bacterium]|nr:preprotein translocase subunit SecE [Clostridiaceae bacterium]
MAKKKVKDRKAPAKGKKKGNIFQRIGHGFNDIRSELKRVVWPDKKKLKQSTATVLAIIVMFTVLIYIFDVAIRGIFTVSGFYSAKQETVADPNADTAPIDTIEVPVEGTSTENGGD